ncbi:MAG: zinc-ribbon domain containing protein [Bacilli bacterium]
MEKQDIKVTCKDCGEEFVFTVGEQEFYESHGLVGKDGNINTPVRCKACRDKKRRSAGRR